MRRFHVYRQCAPVQITKLEWRADLRHVADVYAEDWQDALQQALTQRLAVAPMVEEAV